MDQLPASLPEVPGLDLSAAYVPASEGLEVSGDFYDVFPVQGGWAITVGDVCGKGQEAAAMTAAARHAIRVIAHWNPDPVDVLAKVNEVILAGDYEDRFVTIKLAYLRWDGDHVRVELASSGHPGPAVVRQDGRVDVLSGGGLPLGLFPDAEPERDTLELGQDDLLFGIGSRSVGRIKTRIRMSLFSLNLTADCQALSLGGHCGESFLSCSTSRCSIWRIRSLRRKKYERRWEVSWPGTT